MPTKTRPEPARPARDAVPVRPPPTAPTRDVRAPDAPLRPRRQPRWIVVGVLLTCLGGLGSVVLYQRSSTVTDVVVVTRPVARGEIVQAADLDVRQVGSLNGVSSVPAAALPGLVGQQALVDLSPGLLPERAVGSRALPPGRVELGLRLLPGRMPGQDLPPGTPVLLVPVAAPGERAAGSDPSVTGAGEPVPAVVMSRPVLAPDQNSWLLDVHVAADQGAEVAAGAAADRLALVRSR